MRKMDDLKRNDPIDEHEMKLINLAIEAAQLILKEIPYREFQIIIKEM